MVNQTPAFPRQELHDLDGRTFAFIVSAEEMERLLTNSEALQARLAELERRAEELRQERDMFEVQMHALLPLASPEEEAELQQALAGAVPLDLPTIIAELEAGGGK
jgi:hypothetical protein